MENYRCEQISLIAIPVINQFTDAYIYVTLPQYGTPDRNEHINDKRMVAIYT